MVFILGMNFVSALDVDSCSALNDIGIADSIEGSSVDQITESYSSSELEQESLNAGIIDKANDLSSQNELLSADDSFANDYNKCVK